MKEKLEREWKAERKGKVELNDNRQKMMQSRKIQIVQIALYALNEEKGKLKRFQQSRQIIRSSRDCPKARSESESGGSNTSAQPDFSPTREIK